MNACTYVKVRIWRPEERLWELVLSFHLAEYRDPTQVASIKR